MTKGEYTCLLACAILEHATECCLGLPWQSKTQPVNSQRGDEPASKREPSEHVGAFVSLSSTRHWWVGLNPPKAMANCATACTCPACPTPGQQCAGCLLSCHGTPWVGPVEQTPSALLLHHFNRLSSFPTHPRSSIAPRSRHSLPTPQIIGPSLAVHAAPWRRKTTQPGSLYAPLKHHHRNST